MKTRAAAVSGTLAAAGLTVMAVAAPAFAACDAYSGTCTEPPRVLSTTEATPSDATEVRGGATPSSLPFTGGELVLVSVVGAAAVAGGTALAVAGRRRSQQS